MNTASDKPLKAFYYMRLFGLLGIGFLLLFIWFLQKSDLASNPLKNITSLKSYQVQSQDAQTFAALQQTFSSSPEKILIINFWAEWCAPCTLELPSLGELSQKLGPNGVKVVLVNLDNSQSILKAKSLIQKLKLTHISQFYSTNEDLTWIKNIELEVLPMTLILINNTPQYIIHGSINWSDEKLIEEIKLLSLSSTH